MVVLGGLVIVGVCCGFLGLAFGLLLESVLRFR